MEHQQLQEMILKELPALIQNNKAFRQAVIKITRHQFAAKVETESRFDRMMNELVKHRQFLEQQLAENHQKWEANQRELKTLHEEQPRKWEEGQRQFTTAIQNLNRKFDQTLGALGTRWDLHFEESFRNALAGILKEFPGVVATRLLDYDDTGMVFGYPDQVDLDLIMKNGLLIVVELKSSFSKSEMYIFEKKVRFYEHKYTKQVNRMMVISPMVAENAKPVAAKLGIEIYSSTENVKL